jgi:hypothetical protein
MGPDGSMFIVDVETDDFAKMHAQLKKNITKVR